jgi:hypothetical protein
MAFDFSPYPNEIVQEMTESKVLSQLHNLGEEIWLQILNFAVGRQSDHLEECISRFCNLRGVSKLFYRILLDPAFEYIHQQWPKTKLNGHWLDIRDPKDNDKICQLMDVQLKMIELSPKFCHGYSTTYLESYNSEKAKTIPKDRYFPKNFKSRMNWVALKHNIGKSVAKRQVL